MIQVTNTEHLTGVTISGDYHDLYHLVDALHDVVVHDWDHPDARHARYITLSLRALGITYDIRHAFQGDREYDLRDSGIMDHHEEYYEKKLPRENVYFSCNILYPEMIACTLILNDLIKLRTEDLSPRTPRFDFIPTNALWDRSILSVRELQAGLRDAISEILPPTSFIRWKNLVTPESSHLSDFVSIASAYIDTWNLRYLNMSKEQRVKKLLTITKRLVEHAYVDEALDLREETDRAMDEYGCAEEDLRMAGMNYPEEIEW